MMHWTVAPLTVTETEVPPMVVESGNDDTTTTFAGPIPLPFTTNSAPWAIGEFGSPGSRLVAAFSTAVKDPPPVPPPLPPPPPPLPPPPPDVKVSNWNATDPPLSDATRAFA